MEQAVQINQKTDGKILCSLPTLLYNQDLKE